MRLPPMIAALRRHKAGTLLIGLQIALTLAIVCNAVFIIAGYVARAERPTGLLEDGLFLVTQRYVDVPSGADPASVEKLDAMQRADLATLRALPDVQSVAAVSSLPLLDDTWTSGVGLKPHQQHATARVTVFFGGQQMVRTLGLRLIAGRDFDDGDVGHFGFRGKIQPAAIIVTAALADRLFPHGDALGRQVYLSDNNVPATIVGEVARMLTSAKESWSDAYAWDSVLIPARRDLLQTRYAVRARPGRLREAMQEAGKALFAANPMRVIQGERFRNDGILSYARIRHNAYDIDIFVAQELLVVCAVLLAITGVGITGLTSFWVNQRRRQIGIRRALGARQVDILRYFQLENLFIAGIGCAVGGVLALALNQVLLRLFATHGMPAWWVLVGAVLVVALGQAAVFVPARRASLVPPVVATRSV